MKKIFLVSHCLINNFSKVEDFSNDNNLIIQELLKKNIGLIQLPCPEFSYLGGKRWGMVKEQYDSSGFRKHSIKLLKPIFDQLEDYVRLGIKDIYFIGIKGSPSCGMYHTCSNKSFKGEIENKEFLETKIIKEQGVFVEELVRLSNKYNISLNMLEADENNVGEIIDIIKNIK